MESSVNCVHKRPPQVLILSQINPVNTSYYISLKSIFILSFHIFWVVSFLQDSLWNFVCSSFVSIAYYMSCPSHPPWFDESNNPWVQIKKLLMTLMCAASPHFTSLMLWVDSPTRRERDREQTWRSHGSGYEVRHVISLHATSPLHLSLFQSIKITAMRSSSLDVVPCTQVEAHGRFGFIYCLHLLGRRVSQTSNERSLLLPSCF
jgi:hypothetical protein